MEDILNSSCSVFKFDSKNYEATYMQNVTDLLAEYSWIYENRNIDVIVNNVLDKIPNEWVEVLSKILLNCKIRVLAYGYFEEDWPESLKLFICECKILSIPRFSDKVLQKSIKQIDVFKKTPAKKKEEVEAMSHLVYKVSQAVHSNKVLDIGSGLGYLNDSLHKNYGICSIGLDSVPEYTSRAKDRLGKDVCHNAIRYETLKVSDSEECLQTLKSILENRKNLSCSCNNSNSPSKDGAKKQPHIRKDRISRIHSAQPYRISDWQNKKIKNNTNNKFNEVKVLDGTTEQPHIQKDPISGIQWAQPCRTSDWLSKKIKNKTNNRINELKILEQTPDRKQRTKSREQKTESVPAIMVGLHSCGDLFQDMMKIFCKLDEIKTFICVGCCYHKGDIKDFPMSKAAMLAIDKTRTKFPSWQPCMQGLRLGADRTRGSYRYVPNSIDLIKHLFYRALLEYFIKTENIIWKPPKRHIRNEELKTFSTYCLAMFKGHELSGNDEVYRKLNMCYEEKKHLLEKVGILLILQTWLQPLWEAFITLDRVMYFRERNIRAEALALWNDAFSPRNLALCAFKN